ncbi:ArsR/SmtB family transcription factor [Amycolatopsis sp. H20-H5]|uniref:ArsR/SmtB family transcription factor n=1 Tax=Amycolatopsis sp. H20-H5 TaxID=3046309 RepID=UPI002DC05133|nr:helix-turn-helix domain-containing protein [Amycolatopsis sp. H20-H5]MEC3979100.1 helix-turn-helix domain-containing protein [Amycolatopsis sp. H20-H5]
MPDEPEIPPDDAVHVTTAEQLRAVNSLVRHRILAVLRDGPATITQVAAKLELAKGSSSYHMRLLERAGLIRVVNTRKVRGVVERYYAHTARRIVLPEPAPGQRDVVLRHALDDLATAREDSPKLVRMQHTRISEDRFVEFTERLTALLDELRDERSSGGPEATLAVAFFRPGIVKEDGE